MLATAPKLPVRNQATLREQFRGLAPGEVADTLIRTAARATATSGAVVGVWAVLPFIKSVAWPDGPARGSEWVRFGNFQRPGGAHRRNLDLRPVGPGGSPQTR